MGKRVASSILPVLWLQALLLVAGLSAFSSGDDAGAIIRLPSATAVSGEGFSDEAMMAAASARQRDNKERPWKCCDIQVCTMSAMASCWCHDLLEQCSKACKECGKVRGSNPPRYICKDMYRGDPAPRCSGEDQGNRAVVHHVHGGLKGKAVIVRGSKEGNNGEERPWKCCDKAVITGPTTEGTVVWYCMDKVEHCTCDRCLELEGSRRYYCLDGYEGSDPGPSGTRAA